MSEELYEAFERFCIMSLQSDVGELKALQYIRNKYGKEITQQVVLMVKE